jgi:serine/threonine protein kinase
MTFFVVTMTSFVLYAHLFYAHSSFSFIFSWSTSFELGWAAIQALKAVHNCSILHGDIRASNIMVFLDGVLLLDFGFSRSIRRGSYLDADAVANKLRQLRKLLGWSTDALSQDIPHPVRCFSQHRLSSAVQ